MSPDRSVPAFQWLGRQPYRPIWRRMQERAAAVAEARVREIIWCCEHEPVYTTGRRGIDNRRGAVLPAPLLGTDRGGETTFHGPGQLMLYPVLHLRGRRLGVKGYVSLLEQSCMDMLRGMGVSAARKCGFPGVWVDDTKIAAVGVRVSRGVAYHGMALNIAVESAWFAAINPCGTGLATVNLDVLVTALPPLPQLARQWYDCFCRLV